MITQYEFKTKFQISLNILKFSEYSDYSDYSDYSEYSEYSEILRILRNSQNTQKFSEYSVVKKKSEVKNSRIGCNIKIPKE